MYKAFRDRGYPTKIIKNTQQVVPYENREKILKISDKAPCQYDTFLILEYTQDLDLKHLREALKRKPEEETYIPRPCLSLKKTKCIGKSLVRAKLKNCNDPPRSTDPVTIYTTPNLSGHSAGCAIPGCKCCRTMSRKCRITSSTNNKSFKTPMHTNCNTNCVIYLLECTKCNKRNQYIGQTKRSLSKRLGGHRAASRIKTLLPIYKHFNTPNHIFERDIKLTILEKTTKAQLTYRESHWINTLDTVYPKGLNSCYE